MKWDHKKCSCCCCDGHYSNYYCSWLCCHFKAISDTQGLSLNPHSLIWHNNFASNYMLIFLVTSRWNEYWNKTITFSSIGEKTIKLVMIISKIAWWPWNQNMRNPINLQLDYLLFEIPDINEFVKFLRKYDILHEQNNGIIFANCIPLNKLW